MAIEDLPIIKEEEIRSDSPIVDIAEIHYMPFDKSGAKYQNIQLYYVLGRSTNTVFVTKFIGIDEETGVRLTSLDEYRSIFAENPRKEISRIKKYTSLIRAPGKTE
ncbi:MAG: hypothetical protein ABIF40_04510 [archaeon]